MEKKSKRKADTASQVDKATERVVLVGTYKGDQLTKWRGWYNYPISDEDFSRVEHVERVDGRAACPQAAVQGKDALVASEYAKINELWLFKGTKDQRNYKAEFVGIKTRDELIRDYGYPAKGKVHGDKYLLFKTEFKYQHKGDVPEDAERVIIRTADFAKRSPKIAKQLKAYLESPDRRDPDLAKRLPTIITKLRPEQLRVCEASVQYDFLSMIYPKRGLPKTSPIVYVQVAKDSTIDQHVRPNTANGVPYRMGEFFCGPGGLACGALNACIENPNFKIVHAWANDYDQQTCNTYVENICPSSPESVICADVRKLDLDDKRLTGIDGFAFGFPCNDFSVVGEHKGFDGTYGPLYQYGVAILRKFQPLWFFAENVGGLASANEGAAFKKILESMKDAGYKIYPHLYKFEDYGVPQTRHRIIIIGIRQDQPFVFYPPSPSALAPRDNSSRAALEYPPIPVDAPNNTLTAQNAKVVERLKYIRPGENAFTAKLPSHLQLNVKGAKISQIYKRLDPTKPAYTVTGSGGGGTHIYHYKEPRALTNRERARLQTFPDDYLFTGSKESVRKQIGMAVPPRGAQIIFEALLRTLAGIDYEHVQCNISEEGKLN